MVNCSYCGKELKRLAFCNASHKTQFHRGDKQPEVHISGKDITPETALKIVKELKPIGDRSGLTQKRGDMDGDNYL
jgi:hypothetical protein